MGRGEGPKKGHMYTGLMGRREGPKRGHMYTGLHGKRGGAKEGSHVHRSTWEERRGHMYTGLHGRRGGAKEGSHVHRPKWEEGRGQRGVMFYKICYFQTLATHAHPNKKHSFIEQNNATYCTVV